jgi:hypothetical protein
LDNPIKAHFEHPRRGLDLGCEGLSEDLGLTSSKDGGEVTDASPSKVESVQGNERKLVASINQFSSITNKPGVSEANPISAISNKLGVYEACLAKISREHGQ